ncbi:MAG: hypothetical protein HKO63_04060 [Acidimicrobiia bacterium]|nr:hypothetical protein [Acidimicrobiia bacterium]MBT8192629.1 hypothetical protein [Acidimicrobiia bacterium]NNF89713.1 hypothetical protein [Acidimicrobiia bacterium]NNL14884.1 hypothetical protein [Acidimicrobiia bacterium]NNL97358.1 hypothetical protein [Acidimicrobiia bacterium]
MDSARSDIEQVRVEPTDRPDDPLLKARKTAEHTPLAARPVTRRQRRKTAPPTPDQEGCYYLG